MSFEDLMRTRSAAEYADFVLPSIGREDRIADVGCGPGSTTVGLAQAAGHVTGSTSTTPSSSMLASTRPSTDRQRDFFEGSIHAFVSRRIR